MIHCHELSGMALTGRGPAARIRSVALRMPSARAINRSRSSTRGAYALGKERLPARQSSRSWCLRRYDRSAMHRNRQRLQDDRERQGDHDHSDNLRLDSEGGPRGTGRRVPEPRPAFHETAAGKPRTCRPLDQPWPQSSIDPCRTEEPKHPCLDQGHLDDSALLPVGHRLQLPLPPSRQEDRREAS